MSRFNDWLRRIGSNESGVPLGAFDDMWRPDFSDHPAFAWFESRGRELDRELNIAYYLTRNLLGDVVHAAGGVEYTVGKIHAAIQAAQTGVDENIDVPGPGEWPERGATTGHQMITQAGWELGNLFAWARAIAERLNRSDHGHKVGLIPALADDFPTRPEIERLVNDFKTIIDRDARRYAAYMLHHASIPYPGHGADVRPDGRVVYPLPDPPERHVYTQDQLTFDQRRDVQSFALELWTTVEGFVDGLLDALVRGQIQVRRRREQAGDRGRGDPPLIDDRG